MSKNEIYLGFHVAQTLRLADDDAAAAAGLRAYLKTVVATSATQDPRAVYDEVVHLTRTQPRRYRLSVPAYEDVAPQ